MRIGLKTLVLIGAISSLVSCGESGDQLSQDSRPVSPPHSGAAPEVGQAVVIKSKFLMEVSSDGAKTASVLAAGGNPTGVPVTVINAPDASMAVDTSEFVIPQISNAVLNFGKLIISDFKDNNLKTCGSDGKTRCTTAFIRIYTTGTAGAGLYNAADGYGAPITANLANSSAINVGLGAANAAVVQKWAIPSGKNVLHLSDFPQPPAYLIGSDFTNAGAGSYSTTIVVEYGLSL